MKDAVDIPEDILFVDAGVFVLFAERLEGPVCDGVMTNVTILIGFGRVIQKIFLLDLTGFGIADFFVPVEWKALTGIMKV